MPVTTRRVAHRPGDDGSDREGAHAPYYLVVESVTDGWEQVLRDLGEGVLRSTDVAVVGITFDYRHEVFVAPAEFAVDVVRVGRSSVEFAVQLTQRGRVAVVARVVVARVNTDRTASVPLSERQRAALESIVVPSAPAPG